MLIQVHTTPCPKISKPAERVYPPTDCHPSKY